jgi:hypothetical protein
MPFSGLEWLARYVLPTHPANSLLNNWWYPANSLLNNRLSILPGRISWQDREAFVEAGLKMIDRKLVD